MRKPLPQALDGLLVFARAAVGRGVKELFVKVLEGVLHLLADRALGGDVDDGGQHPRDGDDGGFGGGIELGRRRGRLDLLRVDKGRRQEE